MLLEYFKQYLKISRGIKDKSVSHYITGLNTINMYLEMYNFPIKSVFDAKSIGDLDSILNFLDNNQEFIKQNEIGHNMYGVAFNHFYKFAATDNLFFRDNITKMDIVISKPELITSSTTGWKRNRIVVSQALEGADYRCEHNSNHHTFTSKATGKDYMEGHHIIPLKYQNEFNNSIDIYANVVCLCPTCHRLMHYGTDSDRKYLAEKIYDERNNRLISSGIDLSKNDFLKLAASL